MERSSWIVAVGKLPFRSHKCDNVVTKVVLPIVEENIRANQPIDPLATVPKSVEARLQELVDHGLITWNGKKFQPDTSAARPQLSPTAPKTAAEVVLAGRN